MAHTPALYTPIPFEHHWLTPAEQQAAAEHFPATMTRRRTIRAAALAPSGANQQPWTFVVVSDPSFPQYT